jgi:hypothetical protein
LQNLIDRGIAHPTGNLRVNGIVVLHMVKHRQIPKHLHVVMTEIKIAPFSHPARGCCLLHPLTAQFSHCKTGIDPSVLDQILNLHSPCDEIAPPSEDDEVPWITHTHTLCLSVSVSLSLPPG